MPETLTVAAPELVQRGFWRQALPELSVNARLSAATTVPRPSNAAVDLASRRMSLEGYFQESDKELVVLSAALASAIERLRELGLPPVFVFLFDEAWLAFFRQHAMIASFLGANYQILPDFWAWRIDPAAGQAGWRPHRDKGGWALAADGAPLSLTMWIPLTPATPQNGCMYILPANRDPVYNTPEEKSWRVDYPAIRALPAEPGQYLCWNQAVLHWGAQSSPFAETPRMSMALEFQRKDVAPFNRPLLGNLPNLSFDSRLKLIAKQILQYKHMYPLPAPLQALAQQLLS